MLVNRVSSSLISPLNTVSVTPYKLKIISTCTWKTNILTSRQLVPFPPVAWRNFVQKSHRYRLSISIYICCDIFFSFCNFFLEIKANMCRMHTVFLIHWKYLVLLHRIYYVPNTQMYIKQLSHLGKFLDKTKSKQKNRKLKRCVLYSLAIFTHFYLHSNIANYYREIIHTINIQLVSYISHYI